MTAMAPLHAFTTRMKLSLSLSINGLYYYNEIYITTFFDDDYLLLRNKQSLAFRMGGG
jgi:hypothetical protein